MIRQLKIFLVAITIATQMSCATVSTDSSAFDSTLDGPWQGTIKISETPGDILRLHLFISRRNAYVWTNEKGTWFAVKPGTFRMSRNMSNVVIHATDSETDADGTWVESWAIVATPRSPTELLVVWSRLVNNLNTPLEKESSKFSSHASGVLYRVPRGP